MKLIMPISIGLILLILTSGGIFFALEYVDFSDREASSKAIVAVIGVVGVIFTATIGFIGILIQQSFDVRNLELQRNAETRLTLEAGIKALELIGDVDNVANPPSPKASGAIMLLADLGLVETATRLTNGLWPSGQIDLATALFVIDAGLAHTDPDIQMGAATLLERYVRLVAEGRRDLAAPWPQTLTKWPQGLNYDTKNRILLAMAKYLMVQPKKQTPRPIVSASIYSFGLALADPSATIRANAALCLAPLLDDPEAADGIVDEYGETDLFSELRAKTKEILDVRDSSASTNDFRLMSIKINKWCGFF